MSGKDDKDEKPAPEEVKPEEKAEEKAEQKQVPDENRRLTAKEMYALKNAQKPAGPKGPVRPDHGQHGRHYRR